MTVWMPWILTVVGVSGLWLAGSNKWYGWTICFGSQALWIYYAVSTRQWGFLPGAFAYGAVYARNFLSWRRKVEKASELS